MRNILKITAALLACVVISFSFAGCAANEYEKVIGTCGTYNVLYEELRWVTLMYKQILDETYGDGNAENGSIWDDPASAEKYRAELEEKVWAMMRDNYKILMQCEVYGITSETLFGDEIQSKVSQTLNGYIEEIGGKEAFAEEMEAIFMTENLYRLYLARDQIKYNLRDAIVTNANKPADMITDQTTFYEWLTDGNYAYVMHVMLRNDEGEDKEANRLIASEISINLRLGNKKIEDYVGQRLNDDLTTLSPYYLIPGIHDDALVNAALELTRDRAASGAVETGDAFYVLQRIEEPEGQLENQIASLFDSYLWAQIGDYTDASDVVPTIVLNDEGKAIDLLAIK